LSKKTIIYSVRNDEVTAQALQEIRGKMTEEMGLQMFPENRY